MNSNVGKEMLKKLQKQKYFRLPSMFGTDRHHPISLQNVSVALLLALIMQ